MLREGRLFALLVKLLGVIEHLALGVRVEYDLLRRAVVEDAQGVIPRLDVLGAGVLVDVPRVAHALDGVLGKYDGVGHGRALRVAAGPHHAAGGVVSHQPQFGGERPNDPLRPADPFCHFYECSDGKWIGVFDNEYRRELPKFANLFGMPEIADDPRAASLEALHETDFVVEIVTRLNAIFKTKTVAEWEAFLSENNVSCERMRTIRDVSTDEQAIANGYIQKVTFKDDLEVMMPCPPMQFTEYAMRPYTSAGRLGADTDSIFRDLGYTDPEIAAMKASGAIQ